MKSISTLLLTFLFVVFFNSRSFAQEVHPKIQAIYGDKMSEFAKNNPEQIAWLSDLLDNRIKIIESIAGKDEKYIKLSSVELLNKYNPELKRDLNYDSITFNPLKYNLDFFPVSPKVYRIDNTDYLIVISPQTLNK